MNSQNSAISSSAVQNDDEVNFLGLLDIVMDGKWLLLAITALSVAIAIIYCLFSAPVYQANMLIQVEKSQDGANNVMGQMSSLFDLESPASAEMEILRSRLVLGNAADNLQLYVRAEPRYIPIVGAWLAKRADKLSNPGLFGFGGYVSGAESIQVSTLVVPAALEGQELLLHVTENGYTLTNESGEMLLADGKVGTEGSLVYEGEKGKILVSELKGKPGASFSLIRASRLQTISGIQSALGISEKGKQSGIISATLDGLDSIRTAQILNAIGIAYVNQNIQRKAAEAEKSLLFLNEFLPELRQQMQSSEEEYTQFRDEHGTFDLPAEGEMSLRASADLQTKLLELEQKRRELAPRFKQAHPAIKTLDDQIIAVRKELAKVGENVKRMPDLQQQLLSLTRNVQVNSEMYVNLLNSAQQLRLVKEGKVGNVRVVDAAIAPESPIAPKKKLIVLAGLVVGLLLGLGAVLLRNMMRPGIKDVTEIESSLGLHVFATIPHSKKQAALYDKMQTFSTGNRVLAAIAPHDPAVESLRSLRTSLQFAMLGTKNNLVVLTGATPGIGKSFTSVNFSFVLGAGDKKVLLIDADMRKGYLNRYFNLPREGGLSELISGNSAFETVVHRNVMENVDLLTSGVLPPNPGELLLSDACGEILSKLSAVYDYVLIDTTPVLVVADALALISRADTVFALAKSGVTSVGELEETNKRITQAGGGIKGVIFNDIDATSKRYGTKYGAYQYKLYTYQSDNS